MNICETCRWWHFAFEVKAAEINITTLGQDPKRVRVGHCMPKRHHPLSPVMTNHHFGLTTAHHSCGEHKERDDE